MVSAASSISKQMPETTKGVMVDDRHRSARHHDRLLRALRRLHQGLRQPVISVSRNSGRKAASHFSWNCSAGETPVTFDYILSGAVTVFLTVYLTYALIRPERF
jgi:K+-transporting ATPase KdpF subunit